jgi:glycosyltransferase involved in cell wall biosynthesis
MKNCSIILTVHNKEYLLPIVLNSIFQNTYLNSELIIVFDGCTDNSEDIALNFCKNNLPSNIKLKYIQTSNIFETRANNAGAALAENDLLIFTQDDCIIKEKNFDIRLQKPVNEFKDVVGVTGRCAHNWYYNKNNTDEYKEKIEEGRWANILYHADHADKTNIDRNTFAIRDTGNRGPLLIKNDIFKKIGGFSEKIIKQDLDDHYFFYTAFKQFGLNVGCYWIETKSEDIWGGTRKENGQPHQWLLDCNFQNSKTLLNDHKDLIIGNKHNENRELK